RSLRCSRASQSEAAPSVILTTSLQVSTRPDALFQGEHPDRAALQDIRILAREKQVEAPLHAGGIHAPSRLNRDELLAVHFERYRHTGHARAHRDLPQDLSALGVE